ncbi:post-GPI attachment to proteins factor 3-like [Brassica napus]|uniref:post-GPI attachment to proteins factor 3-like n=1 Tax=Brassica napus TaxID=3708 RepID=UPI00207AEE05|nr:post-GPI attachment to proteins factor 3-like [Brassica napus]
MTVTLRIKEANLLLEFLTLATHCMSGSMENIMETDMVAMMRRAHGHCQDLASVTFSVLSLAMHFHGWLSFFITLYYKLPLKQDRTVFHTRDIDITKRLDFSSAIAVLGFSFIVSILRTFDVRVEAARVMVSAPVLALVTTHILYINFYKLDYASGLAMLLEIYDFPPYGGYFDAHSIWHLATVPLTILWWSFIRDDAEFRTSSLLKKSKTKAK